MDIFASPFILIIAGLIIVVLGIGAGMLLSSVSEEGEPQEDGEEQAPPGGKKGRYSTVARLWRDRENGRLIVEMDGKSFIGPEPLGQAQREHLEGAARDLRSWLGMGLNPVEVPAAPAAVKATETGPERLAADHIAPAPQKPTSSMPPAQPSGSVAHVPANLVDNAAAVPVKPTSIVMQIEDILQDMLAGTELANHGIHLTEDPVRGVIVQVGLSRYEGIEAVPDPQIKAVIRSAVEEWEKTQ